jgi:hypothetical protein
MSEIGKKRINNIVYDLILLEADRVIAHKQKNLELYYKDYSGELVPIAEPYDQEVEILIDGLLKRRKMRYLISFNETIDLLNELKPSSNKVLRLMVKNMNYGNVLRDYSLRDLQQCTGMNMRYVISSIGELCHNDVIRFEMEKNRRIYMVNPSFFYKGTIKKMFYCTKNFDRLPRRNEDLEEVYERNLDI